MPFIYVWLVSGFYVLGLFGWDQAGRDDGQIDSERDVSAA